jgi:RNA polymerase sigma factor (sigma-70 family)
MLTAEQTELFNANIGIAKIMVKRMGVYSQRADVYDHDDAFQNALYGLALACREYDPTRGAFTTYAGVRVRGQIISGLRGAIGRRGTARYYDFCRTSRLGTRPYVHRGLLRDPAAELAGYDQSLRSVEDRDACRAALARLPWRVARILEAVILEGKTGRDVAREFGLDPGRISQILKKAQRAGLIAVANVGRDVRELVRGKSKSKPKKGVARVAA